MAKIQFTLTLSPRLMDAFAQTGADTAEAVRDDIVDHLHEWFDELKDENPADDDDAVA